MASGIIGNDVPRKGLRVRVPCPPLSAYSKSLPFPTDFFFPLTIFSVAPVSNGISSFLWNAILLSRVKRWR